MFWSSLLIQTESTWSSLDTDSYRKQIKSNNQDHQTQNPWNLCGKKYGSQKCLTRLRTWFWQACTNSFPTKANLVRHKITTNSMCDICRMHQEDTNHALYYCPVLDSMWRQIPMWNHDALRGSKTFTNLIEFVFASNKDPELFSVIWNLWNRWNNLLLGKAVCPSTKY